MKRNTILTVVLGLAALGAGAHAEGESAADPFNPAAPTETGELAFLLGDWKLDTPFGEATMHAETILDGFGVRIDQRYPGTEGRPDFVASVSYVFDEVDQRWTGASVNTLGNRKFQNGTFEDGEFTVIVDGNMFQRQKVIRRNTYHDIGPDSFSLRQDSSANEGETWEMDTYRFVATRAR